jgi:hypothetical protein
VRSVATRAELPLLDEARTETCRMEAPSKQYLMVPLSSAYTSLHHGHYTTWRIRPVASVQGLDPWLDLDDLMRRSALADKANEDKARLYAYRERRVTFHVDKDGKKSERSRQTWDVVGLEGWAYRKLIEQNDRPLPGKEQKREEERLVKEATRRSKETPAQRRNRLFSRGYYLNYSPDKMHLFDLRLLSEEVVNGRAVYVVEGTPKLTAKPKDSNEKELLHYRIRRWIDKEDLVEARLELHVISEGSRLKPGTTLQWGSFRTEDGVWLYNELHFSYDARVYKFVDIRGETEMTRSDFHKFEVSSRVVDEAQR